MVPPILVKMGMDMVSSPNKHKLSSYYLTGSSSALGLGLPFLIIIAIPASPSLVAVGFF